MTWVAVVQVSPVVDVGGNVGKGVYCVRIVSTAVHILTFTLCGWDCEKSIPGTDTASFCIYEMRMAVFFVLLSPSSVVISALSVAAAVCGSCSSITPHDRTSSRSSVRTYPVNTSRNCKNVTMVDNSAAIIP